jgi:hypothetical protein
VGAANPELGLNCGRKAFKRWLVHIIRFSLGDLFLMTKNILLAATALSVLGFAGAAAANSISTATVSGISVYDAGNATKSTPFPVASETISSNATRLTSASNTVAFELEDGLQAGATYTYTQTYTGATFATALAASSLAFNAAVADCVVVTKGTNGTAGVAAVTYTVAVKGVVDGTCDAAELADLADPVTGTITVPQFRATAIAPVSVNLVGGLSATNTLVGADERADISQTITLASVVQGYESRIDAVVGAGAGNDTRLSLTPEPVYTSLSGDAIIGNIGYAPASLTNFASGTARLGFANTALPAVVADVELTVSGTDFEKLVPTGFTVDEDDATLAINETVGGFNNVEITAAPGLAAAIAAGTVTFQAKLTPDFAGAPSNAVAIAEAFTGSLEAVELQGTSFIAPWIQSSNPNYNTVIRISNNGSRASGPVQLTLASPLRAPTATTCTLTAVPANGELAINSAQLTSCFGDFGRGDVTATILSLGDGLTAKLRIVSPGNVVSEQSLGAGL